MRRKAFASVVLLACLAFAMPADAGSTDVVGGTRVAKWKGDKTAAFMLMFDDSWPSHFQVAVPALEERNMTATFYINPGKGEYKACSNQWVNVVWRKGMVYGNHTYAHRSATNAVQAEAAIATCNDEILRIVPGRTPRLISYGQPGVDQWLVKPDEMKAILERHHLIGRPDFKGHGAVYHWQTAEQMLALADKAIGSEGIEHLVIHGVERIAPNWGYQDFWALKQEIFLEVLDGLKARRDDGKLWITDHISAHKYETERETAKIQVLATRPNGIRMKLTCDADPQLYDEPLTLVTRMPANWRTCVFSQAGSNTVLAISNGLVRYDVLPDGRPFALMQK
ncbi:MAG: polysaccharide deacetylase family protein [Kiritimatiellia bacterium]